MNADLPPVFDEAVVADVAAAESVDATHLAAALVSVQDVVGRFPDLSVDDIVYEWRTQHHQDPLVDSTPGAYYLDVRAHVWDDVLERGAVDEEYRAATREVHAAQFDASHEGDVPDGAMVLDRT